MKSFLIVILLVLTLSCEEIIEIDIEDSEPKIVIEAVISPLVHYCFVDISKTQKFDDTGYAEPIPRASAKIIINNKDTVLFDRYVGQYWPSRRFQGITGFEYSIFIDLDGKQYTAKSKMPYPLRIDDFYAIERKNPLTGKTFYDLHCTFDDYPDREDYARFSLRIKRGEEYIDVNQIFTYNDRLTNGNTIDYNQFFLNSDYNLEPGDEVSLTLATIDQATYNYFETLKNAIAGSGGNPLGTPTPSNPVSNWNDKNVLGYFSAESYDWETIILE